jgi:hypothetical protein
MKNKSKIILSALVLALTFSTTPVSAQSVTTSSVKSDPTRGISKAVRPTVSFEVWITSPTAIRVIKKESKGNCKAVGAKGKYRGKWQMNAGFWKTYGGLEFAPRADLATCEQQDQVAYRGWLARGWQPWGIKS